MTEKIDMGRIDEVGGEETINGQGIQTKNFIGDAEEAVFNDLVFIFRRRLRKMSNHLPGIFFHPGIGIPAQKTGVYEDF